MRLRIIAGTLGGRFIEAPPGRATRPTAERVREAWFSALGARVTGASAVDLFAGSGALGIEALSRGAASVHFVEANGRAVDVLRRNLERLDVSGRSRVSRTDVFRFLGRRETEDPFDLALADPPYGGAEAGRLVEAFRSAPFARLLCIEHERGALQGVEEVVWTRDYGDTGLTFLAATAAAAPEDPD